MNSEMVRLKYITEVNQEALPETTPEDFEFSYIEIGDVSTGVLSLPEETTVFASAPSRARRVVRPGDTAISTVRTYLRAAARIPVSDQLLIFSTGFAIFSPTSSVDSRYLSYLLISDELHAEVEALSVGVSYPAVNPSDIANVKVWLPDLGMQRQIADFLDRETAQIDATIAAMRELAGALQERRAAAIDSAVTGLGVAVESVETGDRFLPAVPNSWRLSRLSRHVSISEGMVDPEVEPWSEMTLLAPNHIESGTGRILGLESASDQGAISGKPVARSGQIVYSKIRPALNKVAIAPTDCLISADMYAIELTDGDLPRYFQYFMLSRPFLSYVTEASDRVKMPKVNRDELGAAPWPRVPIEDQHRIADHLDETTARMDAMIEAANEAIALLEERRSALISAAVTGRLDPETGLEREEPAA